ncbi:MAG TPA: DUF2017 family protein [Actinomycetes bacterium]|nr:DUF2017 family protein [Actinomycetes bacterium]
MRPEFEAVGNGVQVDLSHWRWVIEVYLDDLVDLLGPLPDVPDDPLDALAAAIDDAPELPSDPVRARLLPDGVLDDPEAAAEFRVFAQTTLLARKHADAAALRAAAAKPGVVDAGGARSLLGALNDLRLMLGTRLGVTEEGMPEGSEDLQAYQSYGLFTYLQGELVDVLAGR